MKNRAGLENKNARFAETAELIETLLRAGTSVRFKATGSSMMPVIRPGDTLTVVPCPGICVRPGQVICFRHGDEMRVHRVLSVKQDENRISLSARGDAVNAFTETVRREDVLGLVTAAVRGGKPVNVNPPFRRLRASLRSLFRKMTN